MKETGRVRFHDAVWGALVAITSEGPSDPSDVEGNCPHGAHLTVVDASGRVRLQRDWTWGCARLHPNRPSTDETGNVFIQYDPGRYDGVIVLRASGGRLEDFGSLPANGDKYVGSGPFGYYAVTQQGNDHTGALQIRQLNNDCTPTCAGGRITHELFLWNGHRYYLKGNRTPGP